MEHRYDQRIDIKQPVRLYSQGVMVADGTTRNASLGGLFVETDYKPEHGHLLVEFEIVSDNDVNTGNYRTKALIARRAEDGLGLMIGDAEPAIMLPAQAVYAGLLRPHYE
ncbi:MAG: PilZ domain-containing protein [Gammaproteobacteria bacterium]|nr:PilZ domain-containing protein [Gammaproteobacteria bacterium]